MGTRQTNRFQPQADGILPRRAAPIARQVMSAVGTTRTFEEVRPMSAIEGYSD